MEFHVSYQSRKKYDFDLKMFSYDGNVIFADFRAVREFAQKINQTRQKLGDPQTVNAGELNALGLMDEIMHFLIDQYRKKNAPELNQAAYQWLEAKLGKEKLDETLNAFCLEFPPVDVAQAKITVSEYLSAANPNGMINRFATIEEILLLWVTNRNPAAMRAAGELFDETSLVLNSAYNKLIFQLIGFFQTQPKIEGMTLIEFLRAPAIAHPDSLFDQLDFIRLTWATQLGEFLRRLLLSLDWLKEESKMRGFGGPGPVEIPVYESGFEDGYPEYEAFSSDRDWMPRLVLIAKNTYVWMNQLSKKYNRAITQLNQIPDEEFKILADGGFTGLWLIGLWQRSEASAKIKQYCGNPEAIASAYSLADYRIADDLGGENAYYELKRKAWRFGIRMASDMVPNHMGIDSGWALYHPDRFISLPYSPFPSYSFSGPNLSPDPNIGVFIEDHYYSRQDAAVVFQRVDYVTGDVRYIYHGNDGTSMPWNDTAQLNYLDAAVREEVIRTILQVAHRFPIIRFDAAMTLAKKHYQRLWFPEPGSGGDIATRAEHAMTKEEFDRVFPVEFWREVVDRVAAEAPDTLLLAEAFWLMEGYFVRTLGMHRVYNSAFMNLLRDEDNSRYRILLKNTLEFDPEILKRYVNFMNNPDERTAVEQFGKGDKYFGICILMATLPGLPMFGHGQIEGYSEKYGMEYKRAYYDEYPDPYLVQRHEREIFPLFHMRRRFAEAQNFTLYNFANAYGNVDENVFAYSNFGENRHSLVVYHNRYGETSGFVKYSANYMVKDADGNKRLESRTLSEALGLHDHPDNFIVLHDAIRNLFFIRFSQQICHDGLFFSLHAYEYYVFDEIYEVRDDAQGVWRKLCLWLDGNGTADISESIQELTLHFVLEPFRNCYEGNKLRWLSGKIGQTFDAESWREIINGVWPDFEKLYKGFNEYYQLDRSEEDGLFSLLSSGLRQMLSDPQKFNVVGMKKMNALLEKIALITEETPVNWMILFVALTERLLVEYQRNLAALDFIPEQITDDWHLTKSLTKILHDAAWYDISIPDMIDIIQWVYNSVDNLRAFRAEIIDHALDELLLCANTQRLLKVNLYGGVQWFNKEMADEIGALIRLSGYYLDAFSPENSVDQCMERVRIMDIAATKFAERVNASDYHFDRMIINAPAPKLKKKEIHEEKPLIESSEIVEESDEPKMDE